MGTRVGAWLALNHQVAQPAAPPPGRSLLYARNGTIWARVPGSGEVDLLPPDQTSLRARRHVQITKDPGSTTSSATGVTTPSWPAGAKRSLTNADDATGPWLSFGTDVVVGDPYGPFQYNVLRPGWSPDATIVVRTDSLLTNTRLWIGFASSDPSSGTAPNNAHLAAFRFNSHTDFGATWRCVTQAGDATSQTVTNSGTAVESSTAYRMRVSLQPGSARFYINEQLVATHTTDLPPASQLMGWVARIATLTDGRRTLSWSRTSILHL